MQKETTENRFSFEIKLYYVNKFKPKHDFIAKAHKELRANKLYKGVEIIDNLGNGRSAFSFLMSGSGNFDIPNFPFHKDERIRKYDSANIAEYEIEEFDISKIEEYSLEHDDYMLLASWRDEDENHTQTLKEIIDVEVCRYYNNLSTEIMERAMFMTEEVEDYEDENDLDGENSLFEDPEIPSSDKLFIGPDEMAIILKLNSIRSSNPDGYKEIVKTINKY